jgi:hypothetical protein
MGFALWIDADADLAWAQGTHEYRPWERRLFRGPTSSGIGIFIKIGGAPRTWRIRLWDSSDRLKF